MGNGLDASTLDGETISGIGWMDGWMDLRALISPKIGTSCFESIKLGTQANHCFVAR